MTDDWPAPGTVLAGRYRLRALLGVGGMSTVWQARDDVLGRDVAVKVLAGPYAVDVRFRAIIGREARAVARLSHPHIVAVHDYGETARPDRTVLPFVVMELVDGTPLQDRLDRGPLPWRVAVTICTDVASALDAAHRHGVVHRDVTPGNILQTATGVKIVDFGIAAPVGEPDEDTTGLMFGTLEYVAPERLDGAPADAATDVFALGVLLHELVTGRVPYPAQTWEEVAEAHAAGPPPPPAGLPAPLADLCVRCLSLVPAERPTAAEAAAALAASAEPGTRRTRRVLAVPAAGGRRTRRVLAVAAAVAGVAAAATALAFAVPEPRSTAKPPATVSESPSAAPASSPPPAPADPVERFDNLLAAGLDSGEIRPDVATDLRNLLSNRDSASGSTDLRRKIDDRVREGSLSRGLARQLRDALTATVGE